MTQEYLHSNAPKHPLYTRHVIKNGETLPVNTYEEVESDVRNVPYVGFSTYVETGQLPPVLGSAPSINHLSEQRVVEIFREQYNALELQKKTSKPVLPATDIQPTDVQSSNE